MVEWERVEFDAEVQDEPPRTRTYCGRVVSNLHNDTGAEEAEDFTVCVEHGELYSRYVCSSCMEEKCWLPEEPYIIEHLKCYPGMPLEVSCTCECHDEALLELGCIERSDEEWDSE